MPAGHLRGPFAGDLGEHGQPGPDVLLALGVVGGQGGHGGRPVPGKAPRERVELPGPGAEPVRLAADLVQRGQPGPAVERGVLHALGHHRAAGLLEPHRELVLPRPAARGAEREIGHGGQGRAQPRGQPVRGGGGRGRHDGGGGGRRGLAGHHVRPVDAERGEQFRQHGAQVGAVQAAQHGILRAGQQPGQPADLGAEAARGRLPLGALGDNGEYPWVPGERGIPGVQRGRPGRVKEHGADHAERVIARSARALPVRRQFLGPGEDLLGDHPGAAGGLGQPVQVAARIGEPVGVVCPQAVDEPFGHQPQQQAVGRGEHVLVLHPYRDERGDVEEPPPVQFGGSGPPVRQPVVLGSGQVRQWQVLGARAHRKHMLVVAQHRPVRLAGVHREVAQPVAGWPGQDRQQQPPAARWPVDVEPVREPRPRPVPQHRPELAVQRLRGADGHVVGHDIGDHAEPVPPELGHHVPERALAAEAVGHPRVVHHVVAVHRPGRGLQDRREVGVGDAEGRQVGGDRGGVGETETGLKLQPVAGLWHGRGGHC